MVRLASRFGRVNSVRRDRPLTVDELAQYVPSVLGDDKHQSRSARYTHIPTITLLDKLREEGFEPFFACQTRLRNLDKREHTKNRVHLHRSGQITQKEARRLYSSALTKTQAATRLVSRNIRLDKFNWKIKKVGGR